MKILVGYDDTEVSWEALVVAIHQQDHQEHWAVEMVFAILLMVKQAQTVLKIAEVQQQLFQEVVEEYCVGCALRNVWMEHFHEPP